jgi:hypothetical protein
MKKDTLLANFKEREIKNDLNEIKGGQDLHCIFIDTDTGIYMDCWDLDTGEVYRKGPPVKECGER